jgi:hypothetical protein
MNLDDRYVCARAQEQGGKLRNNFILFDRSYFLKIFFKIQDLYVPQN